jgi:spore coat protein H
MKGIIFTLLCIGLMGCYKEEIIFSTEANSKLELPTILRINGKECCYDHIQNSLRFPLEQDVVNNFNAFIEFQEYSDIYFEGDLLKNKSLNSLGEIEINKEYEITIKTKSNTEILQLVFTNLPIVQVITLSQISNDPKSPAKIIINYRETSKLSDTYFIGIEHRGGNSQSYQKKSFGFSLKASAGINDNFSTSLFDMRINNDWILDAMWIDQARLRNKTSFELWKKMNDYEHIGIEGKFVELYINKEHQGLYCLNENVNSELLHLENTNAVLYKATAWEDGATLFESYSSNPPLNYYWDGWEQKYPDPKIEINWGPLKELRLLVVNESNSAFTSNITSLMNIDNLVDYYIFLNLLSAHDNKGKNTFLFKENNQLKLNIIPWDIDGSWGLSWDGSHTGYESIPSNNLFSRLIETNTNNFKTRLKQRWSSLRGDVFSNTELEQLFTDNFLIINNPKIIEIENEKWGSSIDLNSEQQYIINWINNRGIFLDDYFENL